MPSAQPGGVPPAVPPTLLFAFMVLATIMSYLLVFCERSPRITPPGCAGSAGGSVQSTARADHPKRPGR